MIPMELVGVRVELPANAPMVLLQETVGDRRLVPIYVGGAEAAAIHYALEGVEPPRPLTHDLFCNVIDALGATLTQVVVTEVVDHTFYAELHLRLNGVDHVVSSRPSDAIALAVRVGCPILATEELIAEAGQVAEPPDDEEDIIDEFKDFIDNINPDDFAT